MKFNRSSFHLSLPHLRIDTYSCYPHRPSHLSSTNRPLKMAQPSQPTLTKGSTFDASAHFEKAASTYEDNFSVMTEIASHLLSLSPPITPSSVIHDNAAGPGVVAGEILRLPQFTEVAGAKYPTIHATDFSPAMIQALEARAAREGWPDGVVKAQTMDSMDLVGLADDTFTHSYMASAIFLVPDPARTMAEIRRTLRPGGVALVTTFERQGFNELFRDVQRAVRPHAPSWKGLIPEEWLTEKKLRAVAESGGFEAAKVEIRRYSTWMAGEVWSKPGLASLKEVFTKSITNGWSDEDRASFERKLREHVESEKVKGTRYEVKIFVALATK